MFAQDTSDRPGRTWFALLAQEGSQVESGGLGRFHREEAQELEVSTAEVFPSTKNCGREIPLAVGTSP